MSMYESHTFTVPVFGGTVCGDTVGFGSDMELDGEVDDVHLVGAPTPVPEEKTEEKVDP